MTDMSRLIIDTDMSFDDLMAILYLLNRSDVTVIGITIAGAGVAHCENASKNALRLLHLAGKADQGIPVARGDEEPSDGYYAFPEPWREAASCLYGASIPESSLEPVEDHAVDILEALLERSEKPVTILGIGPLTNIAQLIGERPDLHKFIENICTMAGALRVKGHVVIPGFTDHLKNEVADWNSYIDPLAAQTVLRSGLPFTVVPLDTTNKVPITTEFVEEFIAQALTPQAKLLVSVLEHELPFIRAGAYYFWDALAASAIVDRDIFRFERRKLDVVVEYGEEATGPDIPRFSPILRSGKHRRHFDLYCSGQFIESDRGHWVDVCTDVDAGAFYARFTQVINGQPPLA